MSCGLCMRFRGPLRLHAPPARVESDPLPKKTQLAGDSAVNTSVHRFQESVAGRSYVIEVFPVSPDRWRAYIVKIPGVPTALMPFYGPTPDQAASQLVDWLTRAHARAARS